MLQDSGRGRVDPPLALVVDKDVTLRAQVRDAFELLSIKTVGASATSEALEHLRDRGVDVLVVGDGGSADSAAELTTHALKLEPQPVVILLVGPATPGGAGEVPGARGRLDLNAELNGGVFDIANLPLAKAQLELLAARAGKQVTLQRELRDLRRRLQSREGYHDIVGRSRVMERLRRDVRRLGDSEASVWICGEPGTGKKLVARGLHAASRRGDHPFVVAHCAGLDAGAGAAAWSRSYAEEDGPVPGLFERADGGTLFLEGITELPHPSQESLAMVLRQDRAPDVRILVGAGSSSDQALQTGRVLEELRDALAATELPLAPLAERPEDLALLARHFIATIAEVNHVPPLRLASDALEALERHRWPGNVRELRNAIEHAVILATDGVIHARDLPESLREGRDGGASPKRGAGMSLRSFRDAKRDVVGAFEEAYLSDLLRRHDGNVTSASQQAGMLRSALQRLLRKYGLKSADFRQGRGSGRRRGQDGSERNPDDA